MKLKKFLAFWPQSVLGHVHMISSKNMYCTWSLSPWFGQILLRWQHNAQKPSLHQRHLSLDCCPIREQEQREFLPQVIMWEFDESTASSLPKDSGELVKKNLKNMRECIKNINVAFKRHYCSPLLFPKSWTMKEEFKTWVVFQDILSVAGLWQLMKFKYSSEQKADNLIGRYLHI